jgi:hypothetical protein
MRRRVRNDTRGSNAREHLYNRTYDHTFVEGPICNACTRRYSRSCSSESTLYADWPCAGRIPAGRVLLVLFVAARGWIGLWSYMCGSCLSRRRNSSRFYEDCRS